MENITFYSVRKPPFTLHGLYHPEDGAPFCRLPEDVAKNTNPMIGNVLWRVTSGARVRFATDSDTLTIRATRLTDQPTLLNLSHSQFGFVSMSRHRSGRAFSAPLSRHPLPRAVPCGSTSTSSQRAKRS